jgi:hypothetical protein
VFYNISQAQETSLIGRTPPGSACTGSPVRVNGYGFLGYDFGTGSVIFYEYDNFTFPMNNIPHDY